MFFFVEFRSKFVPHFSLVDVIFRTDPVASYIYVEISVIVLNQNAHFHMILIEVKIDG